MRDRVFARGRRLTRNEWWGQLMEVSVRLVRRGRNLFAALVGLVCVALALQRFHQRDIGSEWSIWASQAVGAVILALGVKFLVLSVRAGVRADRAGCSYLDDASSFLQGWNRSSVPWCRVQAVEVEKVSRNGKGFAPVLILSDRKKIPLTILASGWRGGSAEFDRAGVYRLQLDNLRRSHTPCASCQKSAAQADRELAALHSRVAALELQLKEHLGK